VTRGQVDEVLPQGIETCGGGPEVLKRFEVHGLDELSLAVIAEDGITVFVSGKGVGSLGLAVEPTDIGSDHKAITPCSCRDAPRPRDPRRTTAKAVRLQWLRHIASVDYSRPSAERSRSALIRPGASSPDGKLARTLIRSPRRVGSSAACRGV
jgi:hypothetical protein